MHPFTDNAGREWKVEINLHTAMRVRDTLQIDLLDVWKGNVFQKMADDLFTLGAVLFCLVGDQAETRNITPEQFAQALAGDALDAAAVALIEDLIAFFPPQKRRMLQTIRRKMTTLEEKATVHNTTLIESDRLDRAMTKRLDRLETEFETKLETLANGSTPGTSPGDAPES